MRILVVDDQPFFRELYKRVLCERTSHAVELRSSVAEALERHDEGGIDLVVTDLVMPERDGLSLVVALRERDPNLPIVVVSQRDDVGSIVEATRRGVQEYLVKPVEPELLRLAVERAADRALARRESRRLRDENLAHTRMEAVHRACLRLVDCLDLERLHDRLLAETMSLTGGQGAAFWHSTGVDGTGPFSLKAMAGIISPDLLPQEIGLDDESVRTRRLLEGAPHIDDGRLLHVPVSVDGVLLGVLMTTEKVSGSFSIADAAIARSIADFSAVALRNALRMKRLQRSGLRDRETAAYSIGYFIDYAGKEIYKARRYGRRFSIGVIRVDNLEVLRSAVSPAAPRAVQRALIGSVQRSIRDSDILSKVNEDTFYLLLPETDYFGAQVFMRRAVAAFSQASETVDLSVPPSMTVGAATWPRDGDDFDELLATCTRRQDEARNSPYRRLRLDDYTFWPMIDALMAAKATTATGAYGRREMLSEDLLEAVLSETMRDMKRDPKQRGLVYYGADSIDENLPLLRGLDAFEESATRVHILSCGFNGNFDHPGVATLLLPEEDRLKATRFFFLLTETASYAWIQRRGEETYHTSDASLVEALVARLQESYDLQRQS